MRSLFYEFTLSGCYKPVNETSWFSKALKAHGQWLAGAAPFSYLNRS